MLVPEHVLDEVVQADLSVVVVLRTMIVLILSCKEKYCRRQRLSAVSLEIAKQTKWDIFDKTNIII
jgi:hypothetical protein